MILKEQLKHIWSCRSWAWAAKAIEHWCGLANLISNRSVTSFAETLKHYRYGILNHCDYPIHTGKLEGVNNKIKVLNAKPMVQDRRYFILKIRQALFN